MAQHKTFVGKLLASIVGIFGGIFSHVLSGAEKTFEQLPDAVKDSLIHGSGIIDIINAMLDNTAAEIIAAIQEKYPDVDIKALEAGLFTIAHGFNLLPEANNLDDVISKLQAYLKSLKGVVWADISHSASLLLAIILAPAGTKFGAIANLIEYVYQTFIKKD